jgi:hypothetical protein
MLVRRDHNKPHYYCKNSHFNTSSVKKLRCRLQRSDKSKCKKKHAELLLLILATHTYNVLKNAVFCRLFWIGRAIFSFLVDLHCVRCNFLDVLAPNHLDSKNEINGKELAVDRWPEFRKEVRPPDLLNNGLPTRIDLDRNKIGYTPRSKLPGDIVAGIIPTTREIRYAEAKAS